MDENTVPGGPKDPNQSNTNDNTPDTANADPVVGPDVGSVISPGGAESISPAPAGQASGLVADSTDVPSGTTNQESPQPFTMDDPSQVAQAPAPEQAPSSEAMPKPFTMDQTGSAAPQPGSPTPPTPSTSANLPGASIPPSDPQTGINPQPAVQPAEAPSGTSPQQATAETPPPSPAPKPNLTADGTPPPSPGSSGASTPDSKSNKSKKLPIAIAVLVLVIALAGFVFGYYIPNQPENVYSTGLDRTGDAIEQLVLEATEAEQLEALSSLEITAEMIYTADDTVFTGNLVSRFDEGKSDNTVDITMSEEELDEQFDIGADVITDIAENRQLPDVFFRIRGLEAMGLDGFFPGVSDYDNRWIHLSADLIKESLDGVEVDEDSLADVTVEDVSELAKTITSITNEYVFSSGENAVFELDEIIGAEEIDGIRTYKYDVSIHEQNARDYCIALTESVIDSTFFQKIEGSPSEERVEQLKTDARENCMDEDVSFEDESDITLWIDRRTKLIHKIRVADIDDENTYAEIGQRFNGDDTLELFLNGSFPEDDREFSSTLITNTSTNVTTLTSQIESTAEFNAYILDVNLEAKPMDESIEIERPSNATPIEEVFEAIMGNAFSTEVDGTTNQTTNDRARDAAREADMRNLRQVLETYYTLGEGVYPSMQQINDSDFRQEEFVGVDEETFRDPEGTNSQLAGSPAPGVYAYAPTPSACDNQSTSCTGYMLYVTLSTGEIMERSSLQESGFTQTMFRLLQ